jgi:type II secretory pathway pseudopilin PulG
MMKQRRFSPLGFTMIELLVVATIMIVLTTIGLVSFRTAAQNSRNAKRKTDLQTTRQALVLYRSDNGCYPADSTFLAMLTTITDYISETPFDPQGSAGEPLYTYTPIGSGDCGTGEATGFTLEATLEPDDTAYTVNNP